MEAQYSTAWDNEYDPRQVFNSTFDRIHANSSYQPDSHVAYTSNRLRIGDVLQKVVMSQYKNSTVNCVNCKGNKTVDFIADTGASDTFTNDLTDFTTFKELNGSVQTADESSSLNIAGYGTVFLRHEVIIKGKKHSVMSKISPVYYAPDMAY